MAYPENSFTMKPWNLRRCQVSTRCFHLAQALRHRGHLAARLDPLRGKQSRASATGRVLDGKKLGKTWEKCVKTWQTMGKSGEIIGKFVENMRFVG